MKKTVLAGLLLTGISGFAQEHQYFVGLDYANLDSEITATAVVGGVSASAKDSDKDTNIALKFGIDNIANGRTYLKYGKVYDKDGVKYKSFSANYDYYITKFKILTPYVGAGIGYGDLSWDISGLSGSDKALEYGVRLGTLVDITKKVNFEIGYNYLKTNADAKYTHPVTGNSLALKGNSSKGLYIGFNYKF